MQAHTLPTQAFAYAVICRGGEKLASLLGTTADLASRAGAAMLHALSHAAASNGHTYMQWHHLQKEAVRLMAASGQLSACS